MNESLTIVNPMSTDKIKIINFALMIKFGCYQIYLFCHEFQPDFDFFLFSK